MDALQTALNAVLPTFLLIGLGAVIDKLLPNLHMETLTRLAVYIFIPALIFNALIGTDMRLEAGLLLILAYLLYLAVLGLLSWLATKNSSRDQARGIVVTALFGNTGNMGLPITLFAYGQAGLERAVILLVISLVVMFSVGPSILAGGDIKVVERFKEALKLPPIWATLAGIMVNALGFDLPLSVERSSALLANAAIPVMLLTLGMQMRRSWIWEVDKIAVQTTALRFLAGPFVAFGVAKLLGLALLDLQVLVLSAAMPAAVTMFVIAVEVEGDYKGIARSVVATTAASLLVITLVILLLPLGI